MTEPVCADSSIILKLSLDEPGSAAARQLLLDWVAAERELIAPSLVAYEIANALHIAMHRGRISSEKAANALEDFWSLQAILIQSPDLHRRALELASELGLPSAYDTHYLAVTEAHECEFWTADERLFNAVRDGFPLIRLLA
jgi:predicted nucleic acid-binding protein